MTVERDAHIQQLEAEIHLQAWEKAKLAEALAFWCEAMESGRSEPLFIARDHTRRLMAYLILKPSGEQP